MSLIKIYLYVLLIRWFCNSRTNQSIGLATKMLSQHVKYGLNRVEGLPIIEPEVPPLVHGIVSKQTCKM